MLRKLFILVFISLLVQDCSEKPKSRFFPVFGLFLSSQTTTKVISSYPAESTSATGAVNSATSTTDTSSSTATTSGDVIVANGTIQVTFSKPMNPATLNSNSVELRNGTTVIPVTISMTNGDRTLIVRPVSALSPGTTYTFVLKTSVTGRDNVPLASERSRTITVAPLPDTTAPTIITTIPLANATGAPVNQGFTVEFSETMDASTLTSTTILIRKTGTTTNVPTTVKVSPNYKTATIKPPTALDYSTSYTVVVTTGVKDKAQNALATEFTASFTTSAAPDLTPPSVTQFSPATGATDVAVSQIVSVVMSEAIDVHLASSSHFKLSNSNGEVDAIYSIDVTHKTVTIQPRINLSYDTSYTISLVGVTDDAGNALSGASTATFKTHTLKALVVSGKVTEALKGADLSGVTVSLSGATTGTATTDAAGNFQITAANPLAAGAATLSFSKSGYINTSQSLTLVAETSQAINGVSMCPTLPSGVWRVILNWNVKRDLDTTMVDNRSGATVVYYGTTSAAGGQLDTDSADVGPETLTLTLANMSGTTYRYVVNDYDGKSFANSPRPTVRIYNSSGLVKTYTLTTSGSNTNFWRVFTFVKANGTDLTIADINTLESTQ